MTAWVIAETGAFVVAPTAALTLTVAGTRACLRAVTRARGHQRQSTIALPRPGAGQPVFLLAAPVAAPAAELVPAAELPAAELAPVTAGSMPQARPRPPRSWR